MIGLLKLPVISKPACGRQGGTMRNLMIKITLPDHQISLRYNFVLFQFFGSLIEMTKYECQLFRSKCGDKYLDYQ